jgi:hypothetical protein
MEAKAAKMSADTLSYEFLAKVVESVHAGVLALDQVE